MNISAFKRMNKIAIGLLCCYMAFSSCKKQEGEDIYRIDQQDVKKNYGDKNKLKNDLEYVSILYSDIFSKSITNSELNSISNVTLSAGDKQAVNELLLQNFLNDSGVDIPTDSEMRTDIDKFIADTYLKFYGRSPNEFEAFYLKNLIEKDEDISPELIYYSFGTSDEYRYY
jgi:hypothetical protein